MYLDVFTFSLFIHGNEGKMWKIKWQQYEITVRKMYLNKTWKVYQNLSSHSVLIQNFENVPHLM